MKIKKGNGLTLEQKRGESRHLERCNVGKFRPWDSQKPNRERKACRERAPILCGTWSRIVWLNPPRSPLLPRTLLKEEEGSPLKLASCWIEKRRGGELRGSEEGVWLGLLGRRRSASDQTQREREREKSSE